METSTIAYAIGAISVLAVTLGLGLALPYATAADVRFVEQSGSAVVRSAPSPGLAAPPASRSVPASESSAAPAPPLSFPDLTQSDPALGLPDGGSSHCGPVAVSNSLIWLALHGYPRLAPEGDGLRERQLELVRELASQRYMATSPTAGTGVSRMLEGIDRWVRGAGYGIARLEYRGWRGHPTAYASRSKERDLEWMSAALDAGGAAWIHVGWYEPPTPWELAYRRHGGHYLTVVDVGKEEVLKVQDPAPYAGTEPSTESVTTQAMDHGWLADGHVRIRADGRLVLGGEMHTKRKTDVAIVDGMIVLVLEPAETPPAGAAAGR